MYSLARTVVALCGVFALLIPLVAMSAGPVKRMASVAPTTQETPPDVLIRAVTEEIAVVVREGSGAQPTSRERKRTLALVEAKLEPHFDFAAMTMMVVGVHWRSATPEERRVLTEEFHKLLLRTYSQTLLSYQDNTIVFKPLHMASGATDATVRVELKQSGREAVRIDFAMEKTVDGWKVYDVTVSGVSIVTNYRGSFAAKIRESGIDGLIRQLSEKNRQLSK